VVSEQLQAKLVLPSQEDLKADHPLEQCWKLLVHLWEAGQEDQNQLDFEAIEDASRSKKKRIGRRRKPIPAAAVEDEDEEMVDGYDA
jgi:hypothetical protein